MLSRQERLQSFVDWCAAHISGDEKGEAQLFLDRFMQAFHQKGLLECGATAEFRIKKSEEDGGGTSFADFVWKPIVLIEMKKRGADLARHYQQAFKYWERLVPGRPRYVILCNFDEFWIYDFDTQIEEPLDKLRLEELPSRSGPLSFLFPVPQVPVFKNNQEEVTREAADHLATLFNKLVARDLPRDRVQRFVLQCLVALFSEDIGLLPEYFFTRLLAKCETPEDAYDKISGLFRAMNTKGGEAGGAYEGVDYFNGGLFAEPVAFNLTPDELKQLKNAAESNWKAVRPEIFGTIFEHSLETEERHAYGAHFTSGVDIMKIIRPTIIEPWEQLIDAALAIDDAKKRRKRLLELQEQLAHVRVLDPACGSGNFLYLAYRSMKRLERRILDAIRGKEARYGLVNASQFYGMDIQPFAVELAKVTMMIARKLAIDELHIQEQALPLDNLDANFVTGDALITFPEDGAPFRTPWPAADVIIGNPPFLGAKRLKPEHGSDYVNAVRKLYPEVPGMADYCVYWIARSQQHLPDCTAATPWAGRAGLVGTQNIRNNKSRVGGLDHVAAGGTIVEAVDNQPWSGEANVHVSIANWVKHPPKAKAKELLIPAKRRLWFKVEGAAAGPRRKKGQGPATKEYEIDFRDALVINSALSDEVAVSNGKRLIANSKAAYCCIGQMVGQREFVLTQAEYTKLTKDDPKSSDVIYPQTNAVGLLDGDPTPNRFVIDFLNRDQLSARHFAGAIRHVEQHVLPVRRQKANEGRSESGKQRPHHKQFLERWWQLAFPRTEMIAQIENLQRYIVCSRVTKRPITVFLESSIRPTDSLVCFCFNDDYSFGVLQSAPHWQWFVANCSKLKSDYRYSPDSVFDTFPWPQAPRIGDIDAVADAGREVRRVRDEALAKITGGLRTVYRTLELPGKHPLKDAHAALDAAVLKAYGFSAKKDLLKQLLDLNHEVAASESRGEAVTAPGVPPNYPKPAKLVTEDCIRPAE
ncbi:hypothetical protein K2D_06450 [Planctomycetes bacterium K2D]|nr:hypothetical protein K2D_06450 [Planctomycetes bacterium K2D]